MDHFFGQRLFRNETENNSGTNIWKTPFFRLGDGSNRGKIGEKGVILTIK
jgi:hypothetical protein